MDEIADAISELAEGPLAGRSILLTVSPVRHTGDGLAGNAVSKAALRLAAEELTQRFRRIEYFPAYEILTDDLRDYRFYADDLVHPAPQAVEYIWACFPRPKPSQPPRHTVPATRGAPPTGRSVLRNWSGSPHCTVPIFGPRRNISADVSK